MPDRLKYWVKLKTAPDIGYQGSLKLLDSLGEPSLWTNDALQAALTQKTISQTTYDYLVSDAEPAGWQGICKYMQKYDIQYLTYLDAEYPALLKSIYSPPIVLYYRGKLNNTLQDWNLGVVGTRKPTEYGKAMTEAIVEPIAKSKVTIISGLAFGIDTVAHRTTLKAQGKTIAVLAHGLDTIYPPQNKELAEQIVQNGALVSEYEPGSKVEKWNFPARNRIISGLSQGVLISEGPLDSGALLTAKFALEQNRDVYAIPGQINIPNAQGPNHLIKNGAKLVTNAEDILQDFGMDLSGSEQLDLFPELSDNEQTIYDLFTKEQRNISFDELVLFTGFSIGQISIVLLNLELKGLLMKASGNMFALK